jgi:hypothetical protein
MDHIESQSGTAAVSRITYVGERLTMRRTRLGGTVSIWLIVALMQTFNVYAKTYYVSISGSDTSAGTIAQPFLTITKAHSVAAPGDTILVRGGTYSLGSTISISKSGTTIASYYLFAYPGERPLLDFSSMAVSSSARGIKLSASYWYIKGFDIKGAGDNGMNVSGSNNIIEFCSFFENRDTGLQLGGGASNNRIINCDSYFNADPGQGNADGFSPKLDVGSGNYFYGCRSWQNSDDGWDGYVRPRPSHPLTTTLENCWTFSNGFLKSGSPSTGNGNGFKMGGSDSANLEHNFILKRCLAFDNRVKGFDQNNNRGSMMLYNCTGYQNGSNYSISGPIDSGSTVTVINCVALGSYGAFGSYAIQQTNSWISPFNVTSADFVSIDTAGVRGPRKSDGSLSDVFFMHLASGSQLIDAGTNVGLAFLGSGPDLGAFEFDPSTSVANSSLSSPQTYLVLENYPNPFNPSTTLEFSVPKDGQATLKIFNVLGQDVAHLFSGRLHARQTYKARFEGTHFPSGIYFARLESGVGTLIRKLVLTK